MRQESGLDRGESYRCRSYHYKATRGGGNQEKIYAAKRKPSNKDWNLEEIQEEPLGQKGLEECTGNDSKLLNFSILKI